MIFFDHRVEKMLEHNNAIIDSVKTEIYDLSLHRLLRGFPGYSFTNINDTKYKFLRDSLKSQELIDSSRVIAAAKKRGFMTPVLKNSEDPRFRYFSRILTDQSRLIFKALMKNNNCKYLFLINAFEATTPLPFDRKTYLYLHVEIYDYNLNRIYGSKGYWTDGITRKMYSIVFNYFVKNAIDDLYSRINILLNPK